MPRPRHKPATFARYRFNPRHSGIIAMTSRFTLATAFGLVLTTAVLAQSAPADLTAAYQAGVAAAKCNLGLPASKTSALGDAVTRIEQRSGLAQGDLDALWSKTQGDADAGLDAFCTAGAAQIDKTIAAAK
jgi:hypothetical protein